MSASTLNTTPIAKSYLLLFLFANSPGNYCTAHFPQLQTHIEIEERISSVLESDTDPGFPEAPSNTLSRARSHVLGPGREHRHDIHHHGGNHDHDRGQTHGHGHGAYRASWYAWERPVTSISASVERIVSAVIN